MRAHGKTPQAAQTVRQMRIVIGALLIGMLSFAAVTAYLVRGGFATDPGLASIFGVVLVVTGVGLFLVGRTAGRGLAAKADRFHADSADDDRKRLQIYVGLKLLHGALAEGFGLIGIVFLLVTGNWYFLAAPILAAWVLLRLFPRADDAGPFAHRIGPGASTHGGAIDP